MNVCYICGAECDPIEIQTDVDQFESIGFSETCEWCQKGIQAIYEDESDLSDHDHRLRWEWAAHCVDKAEAELKRLSALRNRIEERWMRFQDSRWTA